MRELQLDDESQAGKQRLLATMIDRITSLEDALRIHCDDSHPLLSPEIGSSPGSIPSSASRTESDERSTNDFLLDVQTISLADERGQRYFGASAAEVSRCPCFARLELKRTVITQNHSFIVCLRRS